MKGRGTVVTGRVEQGTIKVGEEVEILGLTQVHIKLMAYMFFALWFMIFVFISILSIGSTCEDYCNWCGNVQENFG